MRAQPDDSRAQVWKATCPVVEAAQGAGNLRLVRRMITVFKYPLPVRFPLNSQDVDVGMPVGAWPLSVLVREGQIVVYAQVAPSRPVSLGPHKVQRFRVLGTGGVLVDSRTVEAGGPLLADYKFLGTVQLGWYVAHVFWLRDLR